MLYSSHVKFSVLKLLLHYQMISFNFLYVNGNQYLNSLNLLVVNEVVINVIFYD